MKVNVHIVIILVIWVNIFKTHITIEIVISTDCGKVYTMKTEEMSIKTWILPNGIYADGKLPVVYKRMQICITLTNILWGSGLCFLSNTLAVALVRPFEQIVITSLCIYCIQTCMHKFRKIKHT